MTPTQPGYYWAKLGTEPWSIVAVDTTAEPVGWADGGPIMVERLVVWTIGMDMPYGLADFAWGDAVPVPSPYRPAS